MQQTNIRGFTLIELIVTIGILAIILTIVVVAINPAEQLSRSRDAKRVADLDSMKTAWNLYLAQATTTIDLSAGTEAAVGCTGNTTTTYFISRTTPTSTGHVDGGATNASSSQSLGGAGWAPARIDQTPGGAAIPVLPIDPKGTGTTDDFYYAYACNENTDTFEFTARLESSYFRNDLDVDGTDGGNSAVSYETGSESGLDLVISGK